MNIFANIKGFFNPNIKLLKTADDIVKQVNDFESEITKLSDEELRKSTQYFRDKLPREVTKEDLMPLIPEVFARVREAANRVAKHRHFDVQLIAGYLLANNVVIEVFTGEGKTNIAPLAAYLYGLAGKGVHVVTVNDYLAKRDGEWVGHILDALGMTLSIINPDKSYKFISDKEALALKDKDEVSVLLKEKDLTNMASLRGANLVEVEKKDAYLCDVSYGTSSEFGFDYLRDNMVSRLSEKVQRGFFFSVVDEADSILIDEARTPLIISAPAAKSNELYTTFANIVKVLKNEEDYTIDEKERNVFLTEDGIKKVENMMGVKNLWENFEYAHHLENALKAEVLFKLDDNYIIRDGEVLIVDEFTGRVLPGRRYSEGLHQAIEAKEGVEVKKESKTMATISYQNYFRLYKYLSGMTGTAVTEAEEFADIYKVDVVVVPTYKPIIRKDYPDVIYKTELAKFRAVVNEIESMNKEGRPVLVGTTSIEKSEFLSKQLHRKGIKHEVLNAKQHEREAHIVANAGQLGAVTVATNMAGRGTDIKLGKGVKELGGLHIIGTERHEARRVDNQLRGRSGRLGDPGSSRFFVSLEDELMRRFGGDIMHNMFNSLGVDENMPIEASIIARAIQSAQKKVENVNFEIRKHLVEYDDVLNNHRNIIYSLRDKLLDLLDKEAELHASILNEGKSLSQNYTEVSFDSINFELLGGFLEEFSLLGENWGVNGVDKIYSFDVGKLEIEIGDWKVEDNYMFLPTRIWILQKIVQRITSILSASYNGDGKIDKGEGKQIVKNITALIPEQRLKSGLNKIDLKYSNFEEEVLRHLMSKSDKKDDHLQALQELLIKVVFAVFVSFFDEFRLVATDIERMIVVSAIDKLWTEHLDAMSILREGISLRSYAQKDPLTEYKNEGFRLFQSMLDDITENIVGRIFKIKVEGDPERISQVLAKRIVGGSKQEVKSEGVNEFTNKKEQLTTNKQASEQVNKRTSEIQTKNKSFDKAQDQLVKNVGSPTVASSKVGSPTIALAKVGRNDPCPCGSGKKYKKCCWKK